jgi:hypothetical protein
MPLKQKAVTVWRLFRYYPEPHSRKGAPPLLLKAANHAAVRIIFVYIYSIGKTAPASSVNRNTYLCSDFSFPRCGDG